MSLPTLPTKSLFDLYLKEKESMDDELNPFPKFKEWKEIYLRERQEEMDATDTDDVYVMDDEEVNRRLEADDLIEQVDEESTQSTSKKDKVTTPKPATKSTKNKPLTNMDKARTIFQKMVDESDEMPTRKEVMTAFMDQLKVSKACSSTYHHNIKQKYT